MSRDTRQRLEGRLDALEAEQSGDPNSLAEIIMAEAADRDREEP